MGNLGWKFVGNHRTGDNVCNYIKDQLETYTESAYFRHGSGVSIIFILYMFIRGGGVYFLLSPRENGQIVILENYFCLKWDKLLYSKFFKNSISEASSLFFCIDTLQPHIPYFKIFKI